MIAAEKMPGWKSDGFAAGSVFQVHKIWGCHVSGSGARNRKKSGGRTVLLCYQKNFPNYKAERAFLSKINKKRSLSIKILKKHISQILQRQLIIKSTKALFCLPMRGSLTAEAAFVLPLFLFAVLLFLGFFSLLETEARVSQALQYAGRNLAVYCLTVEDGSGEESGRLGQIGAGAQLAAAKLLTVRYLKESGADTSLILGGSGGILLAGSDFSGDYIDLKAKYLVKLPISFFGLSKLPVTLQVRCRKWIGDTRGQEGSQEDSLVYITKRGEAYHSSLSCRYLDLSIRSVPVRLAGILRSRDGSKYYPCGCFYRAGGNCSTVYITDYGVLYHADLSCGSLVRHIYQVRRSDVGGRHACSGCGG